MIARLLLRDAAQSVIERVDAKLAEMRRRPKRGAVAGLRFRGEATAAEAEAAALSNLLNIIGRRNGARSVISIG